MKTVRAIKIDVIKQEIYECVIIPNLDGLHAGVETDIVEHVNLKIPGCDLYIDEEGLLRKPQLPHFIFDKGTGKETVPFAGHGLIVGAEDFEGQITNCKLPVEDITKRVTFGTGELSIPPMQVSSGDDAFNFFFNKNKK